MTGEMSNSDITITRSSGNVFAELGFPDPDERQAKLRLAPAVSGVSARRGAGSSFSQSRFCHKAG